MKKVLFFTLITGLFAGEVEVVDHRTEECNNNPITKVYYIPSDQDSYTAFENNLFWSNGDQYIGTNYEVKIYVPDKNIISGCLKSDDWNRYSEVAPGEHIKVLAYGAKCIYHKPKNKQNRNIQFLFTTKYAKIENNGEHDVYKTYYVYDKSKHKFKESKKLYKNYHVSRPIYAETSPCMNVKLQYCGDGVLEKKYEECDPADPNKEGWGAKGCSVKCQVLK